MKEKISATIETSPDFLSQFSMLASLRKRDLDFFANHLRSHGIELRTFEYMKFYGNCIICESSTIEILEMLEKGTLGQWFEDIVKPDMKYFKHLKIGLDASEKEKLVKVAMVLSPAPLKWIYAIDRVTKVYRGDSPPVVEHRSLFFSEKHRRDVEVCSNRAVRTIFTIR